MKFTDTAVRYKGRTYRLVSNETSAAIFSKSGEAIKITPTSEGRTFSATTEGGESITLTKTAKPCSCIGGVWKSRASDLVASL